MLIDVITADFSYRDTNMDFMWFIYIKKKKLYEKRFSPHPRKKTPQNPTPLNKTDKVPKKTL